MQPSAPPRSSDLKSHVHLSIISGGNVEPRGLEEEMRSSYLDYAMSVIVGRALPDVRDGLKPVHRRALFSMNENGLQPNRAVRQVRAHRRRRDGQVPPARRLGDLRHDRADGAGLLPALPARRRPGQLRLGRRRSGRRHAVHGGAAGADRARDAARPRLRHGRLRAQLRRLRAGAAVLPARFPNLLVNGSSGIAVGMATNIPPHNLKETIAATIAYIDDPDIDTVGPDAAHARPGLPDRRRDPRPHRHPRRVRDRPRPRARAGAGAHRAGARQPRGDRHHRAALHGQEGRRRRAS